MGSFVSVVELPASPATCWAFVVEHGAEIEPLSFEPEGAQGVGTMNRLSGRVLGVPISGVSRTLVWNPPERCVFESVKPSWPIRTLITEDFEPSATGTRHSIHYEVTPRGMVGLLAAPLVCSLMQRSRRRYQERLKAAIAQRGRSGAT